MSLYRVQYGSFLSVREIADTVTNTSVTVGATTTVALAANTNRIEAIFVNDSDQTIYLGVGANAVLNQGVRLNANGGSYVERNFQGAINAICSSGGKNLTVVEKYHV